MLAQNFKSAADLEITEAQKDALCKTLVLMETGRLVHATTSELSIDRDPKFSGRFNMNSWHAVSSCGTVACIGGTAEILAGCALFGGPDANTLEWSDKLNELFYPRMGNAWLATVEQAARALRSYLTTGDANWPAALETA